MSEFNDFVIDTDLTDVAPWDGAPRPLQPIGEYRLTIVDLKNKPATGNGSAQLEVTFEVAEGPEGSEVGAKIYNNYALSEKARGRLAALVIACGGNLSQIRGSDLMGQTILGTVIHQEGKAKTDADGNLLPARMFANVINERPIEAAPAQAAATKPPVQRGAAAATAPAAKTGNAARRA